MNKKSCYHNRASNLERDFVIARIMDGTYLFAPPCGIDAKGKKVTQPTNLIDQKTFKSVAYRQHSQSHAMVSVPCQRCLCDSNGVFYVSLDSIYKRMLQKGLLEECPLIVDVGCDGQFRFSVIKKYMK